MFHEKRKAELEDEEDSRPRVQTGWRSFDWLVDDPIAKIGYGSRFDVLVHSEFHKRPFWTDYDTY